MEKKKIILPTLEYEGAPDNDLSVRVGLHKNENLLREGDRNIILDISKQYDNERNLCKNYKIYGKLKMIFRNLYYGLSTYRPLKRNLYLIGDGSDGDYTGYMPYNEFAFLRNDVLRELNNPQSGSTPGNFTQNITLTTGYTDHKIITPIDAPYMNWNVYLSYVYSGDTSYPMKYTLTGGTVTSFTSGDGIPFRLSNNGKYYKLTCPVEHGMTENDYIVLSGGTLDNTVQLTGRTFNIESVGDETYNSEKYVINILKSEIPSGVTLNTIMLGKRCTDINRIEDTTSIYYVHKHKTLTNENEYILDKVGFESPIFRDEKKILFENSDGVNDYVVERNRMESVLFDIKEPLVLTGLTNNLGYTPTDVYATVIFRNGNGYFNYPPKVGYKFHFHDTWIDEHFDGNTSLENNLSGVTWTESGYTFTSGVTVSKGTELVGAFVEYNKHELKERIISEVYHKITVPTNNFNHGQDDPLMFSGASVTNLFGTLYQPHHRIKLRQLSPYVETSDTKNIYGLPENVLYDETEKVWKWRDVYDHGYIDVDGYGTNFPFLNNCHYVHKDINFYLRAEDIYTNKKDGISKFKNISKKKANC